MVSNDVAALAVGEACEALLLTAKARVIAPLVVWRRGMDDFLLLTEPELGERVLAELMRFRFAAKAEIELESHTSTVVFEDAAGIPNREYGQPAVELLDAEPEGEPMPQEELERMRIEAGTPRWGHEIDERILPAEAGLDETHISFSKGCYPGQEPIARQHYRGKVNRRLSILEIEGEATPGTELIHEGKVVGRLTSVQAGLALGYVRTDVPAEAQLDLAAKAGFARLRLPTPEE